MDIKVKSLYLKSSPRKIRPALMNLRGQNAEKAMISLNFTQTKGAKMMASLIKSAISIAKENDLELNNLFIKSIYCNDGPRLKRRQIGSRGRSDPILKRMSHLNLIISDKTELLTKKEIKKKETDNKETKKEKK